MRTFNKKNKLDTKEIYEFIDITDDIVEFVKECGLENGIVNIQIMHTSSAIILNENEPFLLEDIKRKLEEFASTEDSYRHDDFDVRTVNMCVGECENGHSHCKAVTLPSSITLNLVDGELQLGTWQRVMFLELDRARPRSYQIMVMGN